jgi:error-prone DNA polymerase
MTYTLATVTTHYDLLRSTITPGALLDTAQRLRLPAVGIVDRATTLAHAPLAVASRDTGVHVVYGTTLTMEDGYPLRLLARDERGYRNLCHLVRYEAQRQERITWDALRQHNSGLYLLCGGRRSRLWQAIVDGDERVLIQLARLQALGERDDRFVVEVQQYPTDSDADHRTLRRLLDLAHNAGVRTIATHDAQILHASDASRHRLLHAIDRQLPFWSDDARLPPWRAQDPSRFALPEPRVWHQRWEGLEHLVADSAAMLNDCTVELLGKRRFPGATLPAMKVYDDLWKRAFVGLRRRYPQLRPDLMERLAYEVNEVMAQEVGAFLLHVAELVERAAKRGIKMVLQGSGTGSLLCYALGISPVDPMSSEAEALVFERFAGAHRGIGDLPDLDFGVPADREMEIRGILVEMFGSDRVASLAAVVTLRERGAIRVAAAAFGFDRNQIRMLHAKLKAEEPLDRFEQMVVKAAHEIAGQPSHLMRHASGVVVANEPLDGLYGVGQCPDGPLLLANKDDVEHLQLLKIDVLNWYVLAIFDHAERSIHRSIYPEPDVWHVDGTDSRTGDMLEQADTRSIPYLQSPACMTLIRALKVRTEADIALCLGALRPGASHTRDRLMAAIHGGTAVLPGWERLTDEHQAAITKALAPSRGALIFDEDLLRLAHLLGLSYPDAERLRKAMKKGEADGPMTNLLRAAAISNGWAAREIDTVLHWFTYIKRYTFTRGHAIAMAHVAWRAARLQAHYPAFFYAGVMDHLDLGDGFGGMYPTLVYVVEARRHGIAVRGPSINGPWESTADGAAVQCGLRTLRASMNVAILERIHAASHQCPFTGVADLCRRVELSAADVEKLIAAGTVDDLVPSRRHARWEVQYAHAWRSDQSSLLDDHSWQRPTAVEAEGRDERGWEEYAALGWTLSVDHPLDLVRDALHERTPVYTAQLQHHIGQVVDVAGVIVARRRIPTVNDRPMLFASLCDYSGTMELTLYGDAAERYDDDIQIDTMLVARGVVTQDAEHGIGVRVQAIHFLGG